MLCTAKELVKLHVAEAFQAAGIWLDMERKMDKFPWMDGWDGMDGIDE